MHRKDGAGPLQHVADKLHGGGAHGAGGIDGEGEVVNLLIAGRMARNQQLFILGPIELRCERGLWRRIADA